MDEEYGDVRIAEPQSYALGFRVSEDVILDFGPLPEQAASWRRRITNIVREIKWRVGHAYDALVHGDCGYIE